MAINKELFASLANDNKNLVPFSDTEDGNVLDWLPTLSPQVDATMMGGIPLSGKATEIFGSPSVGKSTVVAELLKNAQKLGLAVIYFDTERTTSNTRLKQLGVDPNYVLTMQPTQNRDGSITPLTVEDIFDTMISTMAEVHSKDPKQHILFVWDTVAMTQPRMIAEKDIGSQTVGQQARALTEGIRKLNDNMVKNGGALIALNQERADMSGGFISEPTTIGGYGWIHEMSLRLYLSKGKKITVSSTDKTKIGQGIYIKFIKSKVGDNDGARAEGAILKDTGFDLNYNLYKEAEDKGLITGTQYKIYVTDNGEEIKYRAKDWLSFLHKRDVDLDKLKQANDKAKVANKKLSKQNEKAKNPVPLYKELNADQFKKVSELKQQANEVFTEIFQKLIKQDFPTCYPPLFNKNIELTDEEFPFLKGLRDYYIKIQEGLDEDDQHTNYRIWKQSHEASKRKK